MNDEGWIVIPHWDGPTGFQHYSDRTPRWIKNYVELLHDDAYLGLTLHQRGVLHGLWMEYAAAQRQIPDSTLAVTRRLSDRVTRATLEALNRAGFIEFSASKPLAQNREEKSRVEKKGLRQRPKAAPAPAQEALPIKAKPREPNPIWDTLTALFGEPATPSEKANRGKTCRELKQAGATPEEIRRRTAQMTTLGWDSPSENALRNRWTMLGTNGRPGHETPAERLTRLRQEELQHGRQA